MVFSSVPFYQDPPNWQQPQQHPNDHETLNPHSLQLPPQLGLSGGATALSNKPTSERARLAKIPVPDGPLRCPRPGCESTNTKFCYFNNYNLSQPRHFCKACRRYWTRGGALRNVPVGGACRRNKRRKKSPASAANANAANGPKPGSPPQADQRLLQPPAVSFMASLQNMTSLGMGVTSHYDSSQIGYMAAPQPNQQLSFLAGLTGANSYMYPYGGVMETASFGKGKMVSPRGGGGGGAGQLRENVGQFWSAHMNNGGTAAAAGSSLYMDGSFRD